VTLQELTALIPDSRRLGNSNPKVTRADYDSRQVRPGSLFVALVGQKSDGHRFLADAFSRGAVAAVVQAVPDEKFNRPLLVVPDTRRVLAIFARALANFPDQRLKLIGITGTNGKTSTAMLLAQVLSQPGSPAGLISTVGISLGNRRLPAERTTPEAPDICDLLNQMLQSGCRSAVMEVSSHALTQDRVYGLQFAAAAFTNLTQDHLDYHGDMEGYFSAKARLFKDYNLGAAVINLDDPYGRRLAKMTRRPIVGYSLKDASADVYAADLDLKIDSINLTARTPRGNVKIHSPLVGQFNAYNLLCALAVSESLGLPHGAFAAAASQFAGAPGRLEKFDLGGRWAYVDYAHTPDALAQALQGLRSLTTGPLHVLFGCGGNRDRAKRPLMAHAAEAIADKVYVTSDNPRDEDPAAIAAEIRAGFTHPARAELILDRREAIRAALAELPRGGMLLIAGKGHEDYQEIRGVKHPFDDRAEVRRYLAERK